MLMAYTHLKNVDADASADCAHSRWLLFTNHDVVDAPADLAPVAVFDEPGSGRDDALDLMVAASPVHSVQKNFRF